MIITGIQIASKYEIGFAFLCAHFVLLQVMPAQNLIPNNGFEEKLDITHVSPSGVSAAPHWQKLGGSSDFFHRDYPSSAGVPGNNRGWQEPYEGNGYAGIFTGPGTREYLYVELTEELERDVLYDVQFVVSLSDIVQYATSDVGITFTWILPTEDSLDHYNYSIRNSKWAIITDTINWVKISGQYVGKGGERYLIIGNFTPNRELSFAVGNQNSSIDLSYFFIDEVTLQRCTHPEIESFHIDTAICEGAKIRLMGMEYAASHYWDGFGARESIEISTQGTYKVNNFFDCRVQQQVYEVITEACDCNLSIPTLISVYERGSIFEVALSKNVVEHELTFFNASGHFFAYTNDPEISAEAMPKASGMYFWRANLKCTGIDEQIFNKVVSGKLIIQN